VQGRRAEDLDCVDIVVGEHLVELRVATRYSPLRYATLEHLRSGVAQCHDFALFVLEVARHVQRRDVARADDSHPHTISRHFVTFAHVPRKIALVGGPGTPTVVRCRSPKPTAPRSAASRSARAT